MRLLKNNPNGNFSLTTFRPHDIPPYAILSHTWETDDQELTFQEMENDTGRSKAGYGKIQFCGEKAKEDGLQYFWVDSCCINRSSSSELIEAINSMFRWYRNAAKCYVYLSDVPTADGDHQLFRRSRWFTRGWTLQELLAPQKVEFFSRESKKIGDKQSLELQIHETTGIPVQALQEPGGSLAQFSVDERFSWTANRQTTVEEDQAYCLLGIFKVYLPLIYGEGKEHAFHRLRMEISTKYARDAPNLADASITEKTNICLAQLAAKEQNDFVSQTLSRSINSCTWILKNQEYISWLESHGSSLLWMTAPAGCGKTTIAAHVSRNILSGQGLEPSVPQKEKTPCAVVSFFFQKTNLEDSTSAQGTLRSLLSQLVRQLPELLHMLLKRHELLSAKGDFEWSWDNLSGLFGEMIEQATLNSQVFLILDAIDECETKSQILIVNWIKRLIANNATSAAVASPQATLKVLVTSRPYGNLTDRFSGFPTLAIEDTDTERDMQMFIHNQVEELAQRRCLGPDITKTIIQFLETKAHGMFLWVGLVVKELERRDERLSDESIQQKLSKIPLTLADTYEAIIGKTSPSRRQDMWRIIRWMLFGTRDVTLAELERGLCLEIGISNWYDLVGDLRVLCGSFIRLHSPRDEIKFVHQTARVFLERYTAVSNTADTAQIVMDVQGANEHLAAICIHYMFNEAVFSELECLLLSITTRSSYENTIQDFLSRHPFLRYAIESWHVHLRLASTPSSAASTLVVKLLSSGTTRDGIMRLTFFLNKQGTWNVPTDATPLHLAAYFNIPWLVQIYILINQNSVHATTTVNDTPLIWASEMGCTECVQMLLDAGADPNELEIDGWSALHWAARNGHSDVAILLLEHDAFLDHRDKKGYTPLDWAVDREQWNVVKIFDGWIAKKDPGKLVEYHHPQELNFKEGNLSDGISRKPGQLWDHRP